MTRLGRELDKRNTGEVADAVQTGNRGFEFIFERRERVGFSGLIIFLEPIEIEHACSLRRRSLSEKLVEFFVAFAL